MGVFRRRHNQSALMCELGVQSPRLLCRRPGQRYVSPLVGRPGMERLGIPRRQIAMSKLKIAEKLAYCINSSIEESKLLIEPHSNDLYQGTTSSRAEKIAIIWASAPAAVSQIEK